MSSLQRGTFGASKSADEPPRTTPRHNNHSFESIFSAGLDLTEFATAGGGGGNGTANFGTSLSITAPTAAASADLARRKVDAAARRNDEEREEAALERRVADVADSSKLFSTSTISPGDLLGAVVPRAVNPNDDDAGENDYDGFGGGRGRAAGRGRDDNFVRFQEGGGVGAFGNGGGIGDDNGFLSSLVSGHESEARRGTTMSHKSRAALLKNRSLSKRHNTVASSSSSSLSRRQEKQQQNSRNSRSMKATKKSRKSKH